jgi:glycosyltransferase involved in cell wall biosynthesis
VNKTSETASDIHAPACSSSGAQCLPLASFIILSYNQENYVGDAVAGALAQDYPNLEVILSDHTSTDRTFHAMERAASAYSGPHKIYLQRSRSQLGVLGHALDAVSRASGQLIIAAAGDDVSQPQRASRLVERWLASGAALLFSDCVEVDERGRPNGGAPQSRRVNAHVDQAQSYFPDLRVPVVHGASAAYDRRWLMSVAPPNFPVFQEDYFLTLMFALASARFEYIDEPLVLWRRHANGLSRPPGSVGTVEEQEKALAKYSAQMAQILDYVEAAASGELPLSDTARGLHVDLDRLRRDAEFHKLFACWHSLPFLGRASALARLRRSAHVRSLLPRLFGLRALAALRKLKSGLPLIGEPA